MRLNLVISLRRYTPLPLLTVGLSLLGLGFISDRAEAQSCVDTTGQMCLDLLTAERGDGSVVNDIFQTSDGRFAPQLNFATYVRGIGDNTCVGQTGHAPCLSHVAGSDVDPALCRTVLEGYTCGGPLSEIPLRANSLDWLWTQVLRTDDAGNTVGSNEEGFYYPWRGRIYDLNGEANRVVLFPVTDHGPLPCEAFEYSVWLTNNPDATAIAPESAPDPNLWNPARMIRGFTEGWTRNVHALGAGESERADLSTFLRDTTSGDAIADSITTVWALPCGMTFRYASIQAGNYGNPGPACAFHSTDDELDAVAGLNEDDTAICVDADSDGHRDVACGGTDCDDDDADVHPGAFERCDASEDTDCSPARECGLGSTCDTFSGLCVARCFEGGCQEGYTCVDSERCVEEACAALETPCDGGTLCRGGECLAPCDGVICPSGESCVDGACMDPCAGVACPTNQVCIARDPDALTLCGPACTCTELGTDLCDETVACDARPESPTTGLCVDPTCVTVSCGTDELCVAGACVDRCQGVACPFGQECLGGSCAIDPCASVICSGAQVCREGACVGACEGVTCDSGMVCQLGSCVADPCASVTCDTGERCEAGACVADPSDGGAGGADSGGIDSGAAVDAGTGGIMDGGCGCRLPANAPSTPAGLPLLALALFGLLIRSRRRR